MGDDDIGFCSAETTNLSRNVPGESRVDWSGISRDSIGAAGLAVRLEPRFLKLYVYRIT